MAPRGERRSWRSVRSAAGSWPCDGVGGRQPAVTWRAEATIRLRWRRSRPAPPRLVVQVLAVGQDGVGGRQQLLAQVRLPGAVPQ